MDTAEDESLILALDSPWATLELVGGKAASLSRLAAAGLPMPPGFTITTLAYRRFVSENHLEQAILNAAARVTADDPATLENVSTQIRSLISHGEIPEDIASALRRWYGKLGGDGGELAVAVRSSATAEDLPDMSFAGQQETYLNVCGYEQVSAAVKRCWGSLWTARALGYRARHGIRPMDVALAVVVQELVPAEAAGVLFTANPTTGAREDVMINAAWGLGEAIVNGDVTPDLIVINKQAGTVAAHETSDKDKMTVRSPEGTRLEAVPAERRKQPALQAQDAVALARLGAQIEQLYGRPMDVEWALCAGQLFILQARPITALPEPPPTLDWPLPHPKGRYGRSSVIELLPDPLTPLFATLALPLWSDATRGLMQSVGLAGLVPQQVFLTINDYAYYDFSAFRGWRMIWALLRMVPCGIRWLRSAQARWADLARPRYAAVVSAWAARDLAGTPAMQLLDGACEIVQAAANHYATIQSGIIPVAWMSELMFTAFYNRFIKRKDDPPPLCFVLGFDSTPILAEKSLYDLATWARSEPQLAEYLARASCAEIAAACQSSCAPIAAADRWFEFCRRFAVHLDRFGHAVYDLDFAKGLAADEPAPLFETLKHFLGGTARDPHKRQSAAAAVRERATQSIVARLRGVRLRWFNRLLRWAQRYAPLREDALADTGLGWPLLRRMIQELGRRLVVAGAIARRDDVFWLAREEVEAAARALDANQPVADERRAVAERRATWSRERRVTPPVVLPKKGGARVLGIDFSRWMPARTDQPAGDTIRGIAASPGRVAGRARVITGPGAFERMRHGDILVAKITTPAWTPLFALASGVVTDVGGPLSHSSIVAREYQIPAVLGTGVATERIRDAQHITVDGDRGVVTLGGRSTG